MSISSCPRCSKQVTLPVGASQDATVRCPLCHAQYALSEAWLTMPPLLELIEDVPSGTPGDRYDLAGDYQADDSSLGAGAHRVEFPSAPPTADAPAAADDASHVDEPDEALEFEAFEIEHDDLVMQEQDTEVEDLSFATSDPLVRAVPDDVEHIEIVGPDEESVLDLGQPTETPDLTEHQAMGDDEPTLDFGQPEPAAEAQESEPGELDFGQPQPVEAGEEIEIDFGEMQEPATATPDETLDFSQPAPSQSPPDDEISLDFGEPVAAPVAKETQPANGEPVGKQDKKAKKEPKKNPRPAKSGAQRSVVGRLMLIVLPGLFVVPLVYYAGLWMSPDYDIFKIGGKLPAFMAPPGAKPRNAIVHATPAVLSQLPPQSPAVENTAAQPSAPPPDPTEAAPNQTPADEAPPSPPVEPTETPASEPPAPAAAEKDLPEPPVPTADAAKPEPEDKPVEPVENATDESAAKDAPSAEDKPEADPADPVGDLISPAGEKPEDMPADETPEEMPAEAGDAAVPGPLDDVTDAKPGDSPTEVTEPAGAAESAETAEALGPRDARAFTPDDLAKALHEAARANEKMTTAQNANDEAEIKKVRAGFYLSLYGLADVLTFAKAGQDDPHIDAQRQGLEQVVLQLAADPQRLKAVKANAAKWLKYAKRTTPGILLAGTVQSVEPMGKLFEIQLRVTADSPVVTVISATDPRLSPEDEAVTLGSIVEDPVEQLAGYEGNAAAIVWSGMTLKLPPEAN
jgi:hypothetical protein